MPKLKIKTGSSTWENLGISAVAGEWSAATVDQSEAEAGAATTRRAWTAQRVAQAIAAQVTAWWAALTVGPSKITMSTARLLGRTTAGSGAAEEISIGSGLSLSAGVLTATASGGLPTGVTSPGDGALDFATGSLTASRPSVNVAQTWNNSGVTFAGWRVNITDTASAAASLLADLQVGGVTRFSVSKLGAVTLNGIGTSWLIDGNQASGHLVFGNAGNSRAALTWNDTFNLGTGVSIAWTVGNATQSVDLALRRDAANTLAQRNGTNAQTSRLYGTFTDASNHRRLSMGMSAAGVAFMRPEGAGSGASGNVLHISGLPTSNPGPGILWNDAGTVKVGT